MDTCEKLGRNPVGMVVMANYVCEWIRNKINCCYLLQR